MEQSGQSKKWNRAGQIKTTTKKTGGTIWNRWNRDKRRLIGWSGEWNKWNEDKGEE